MGLVFQVRGGPSLVKDLLRSRTALALAAVIAAGAAIRFATLGHQSYDHDEAATLLVLHPSLGATWHSIVGMERNPPLYYFLAWPWTRFFGTSEAGLRSLSALFGLLTIPAAFLCARELAGRRAGLIAGALVAFNPYLVWYSQEARSYALLVCFSAWALYAFLRATRDPSGRNLGAWALAGALALASHYFAVFLLAPEAALLVGCAATRRRALAAAAAVAGVGIALAPLAIAQAGNGGGESVFMRWPPAAAAFDAMVELGGSAEPHGLEGTPGIQILRAFALAVALTLVVAGLVLFVRSAWRARDQRRWMVLTVTIAGLAAPFAIALFGADYVDPRNLIGCVVPLIVVLAVGLASRSAPRLARAAALAWTAAFAAVVAVVWASPQMQRPDWRAVARATEPEHGTTVLVVPHKGLYALSHYLRASRFKESEYAGGLYVRHIDVVDGASPIARPQGFRPGGVRSVGGSLNVERFTSRFPVDIRPDEVDGTHVLDTRSNVLVETSPTVDRPS
jgi:mannosyltransferase